MDYLDKKKINNYNIHIFCDCKPAIISSFIPNRHLVKSHIIQDIQQLIKSLYIKNNVLNVIWCPGHMGIQGNEIADELAKSAAKQTFVTPNQLLSGHSNLNYSRSKRNKDVSGICLKCGVKEDLFHFVFDCIKWNKYRDILEEKVLKALHSYKGVNINLKTVLGMNENLSTKTNHDITVACLEFIRNTGRFSGNPSQTDLP